MLTSEIYYRAARRDRGRWYFAIVKLGRLRQVVDRLVIRRCSSREDAHRQAAATLAALANERITPHAA